MLKLLKILPKLPFEYYEMKKRIKEVKREINSRRQSKESEDLPLVSICIPTRNEEKYLEQALFSIKEVNRYPNFEIIVADYKSKDRTVEIAEKHGARAIELDRAGVGYARHIASLEAKGDIIVQIDADTFLTPKAIERAVESLQKHYVYHPAHYYYDGGIVENLAAHI